MFKKFFGKGAFIESVIRRFPGPWRRNSRKHRRFIQERLEGSMVAMQQNIKAKTLKEIAIAVALLAGSMVALSFIDPEKLGACSNGNDHMHLASFLLVWQS